MASFLWKRGKLWVRLKGNKTPDKWSAHPCPADVTTEDAAQRYADAAQAVIDKRNAKRVAAAALTLRAWATAWLAKRQEAGLDWRKDRSRLDNHVLPVLGDTALVDITPAMIADLVHDLRFKTKLANRSVRNIYSVLAACMRDARMAGKRSDTPCILTDAQLGPIVDKNPEWRSGAVYSHEEAEAMISAAAIPLDRRIVYALGLLAGLRPGEGAALRWRSYVAAREPLGMLTVALAYSTTYSHQKGTKTHAVKYVPVHPTLAALLEQWRDGWSEMFGREPGPDDLIVPLPPDVKRTKRTGDRFRGWDYTGRRWRKIDQPALGWRARSVYDTRATFITLAIEDGARRDILRERVTHAKPRRDAFDGYDRGERWAETCREVAKLRIALRVPEMYPAKSSSEIWSGSWGLHRRSAPHERRAIQEGREVGLLDRALERARLGTRDVPATSSLLAIAAESAPDVVRFAMPPLMAKSLRLEIAMTVEEGRT